MSDDTVCPPQWFGHQGSCYLYVTEPVPSSNVIQECRKLNSLPATINSDQEYEFLMGLANAMPYLRDSDYQWTVGAVSPDHTHNYWSLDPSLHNVLNWAHDHPGEFGRIYVTLTNDGEMVDTLGDVSHNYICERHPGKTSVRDVVKKDTVCRT